MPPITVNSEIGNLKEVILLQPGNEIERMIPQNIAQALYSDVLNKSIVQSEYNYFDKVLSKWCKTYKVHDLLEKLLENQQLKETLVEQSCLADKCAFLMNELLEYSPKELAYILIEGYAYNAAKNHPLAYKDDRYILKPLYNFFFTRDASSALYDKVLINSMYSPVRKRESIIMQAIFQHHFGSQTINPAEEIAVTEGGDILVAREDTLLVGCGPRTNKEGIDFLVNHFAKEKPKFNILVQELPEKPDSFIHLDMVFTFLDKNVCMIYEPLIKKTAGFESYRTTHIAIDNGKVTYNDKTNFLQGLKDLNFDLEPILCGGNDEWNQAREQWHSGANFFAMGEGKIIGYQRNAHTIEALNNKGFEVLKAKDICEDKIDMHQYNRFVVTFEACELPRGGGGARCMTMPVKRDDVLW